MEVPEYTIEARPDGLFNVYYTTVPYNGQPVTRVWGIFGNALTGAANAPCAIVLHGGGGTATPAFVQYYQDKGYAAFAIDTGGLGPDGAVLPNGSMDDATSVNKYGSQIWTDPKDLWHYHAVAHILRGISLLKTLPGVDPNKIFIHGSSWGSHLAALVLGIEAYVADALKTKPRLKAAVLVYGSGYMAVKRETCVGSSDPDVDCADVSYQQGVWRQNLDAARAQEWLTNFDPASYFDKVKTPIYFALGADDANFRQGLMQRGLDLLPVSIASDYRVSLGHSDVNATNPASLPEAYAFVDSILRPTGSYPRVSNMAVSGAEIVAVMADAPLASASLNYTLEQPDMVDGGWDSITDKYYYQRSWTTVALTISGQTATGTAPPAEAISYFVTMVDTLGRKASSKVVAV
jgi:cephalosporin-C deacetylase-like acetyl esterase